MAPAVQEKSIRPTNVSPMRRPATSRAAASVPRTTARGAAAAAQSAPAAEEKPLQPAVAGNPSPEELLRKVKDLQDRVVAEEKASQQEAQRRAKDLAEATAVIMKELQAAQQVIQKCEQELNRLLKLQSAEENTQGSFQKTAVATGGSGARFQRLGGAVENAAVRLSELAGSEADASTTWPEFDSLLPDSRLAEPESPVAWPAEPLAALAALGTVARRSPPATQRPVPLPVGTVQLTGPTGLLSGVASSQGQPTPGQGTVIRVVAGAAPPVGRIISAPLPLGATSGGQGMSQYWTSPAAVTLPSGAVAVPAGPPYTVSVWPAWQPLAEAAPFPGAAGLPPFLGAGATGSFRAPAAPVVRAHSVQSVPSVRAAPLPRRRDSLYAAAARFVNRVEEAKIRVKRGIRSLSPL